MKKEDKKLSKAQLDRHIARAKVAAANLMPVEKDGKLFGVTKKVHGAGIMAMASSDGRHFIYMVPEIEEGESTIQIKGYPAIEVFPIDEPVNVSDLNE